MNAATLPAGSPLTLAHTPVTCAVAGENPQFNADIQPKGSVAKARVYFRSSQTNEFYYVEMKPSWVGKLPQPKGDIGSFVYYIEALSTDGSVAQTPETTVTVARNRSACPQDAKVADAGPGGPVNVFSAGGATTGPAGFTSIGGIVAGGAITAGGSIAGGAAGGLGTGVLIAGGAVLAGLTTLIVVSQNSASR